MNIGTTKPSELEQFVSTSDGLRTVLVAIDRIGPEGWQLPAVEVLMKVATRRYTPVARAWHRPPEDAAHAAWLAMRGRSARAAEDPWGVVTRAVELSMQAEAYGDRLLISPDKARRPAHRPPDAPVRAGEHQEFLYDVIAVDQDADPVDRIDRVVATIAALLAVAGWNHHDARWAVEYVASRTADLGSQSSARDVLRRDGSVRLRLGMQQRRWTRLLAMLIGSAVDDGGSGRSGLLERVLLGETLTDLVADADLVRQARLVRPGTDDG
jgi:hypothetical protein